MPTYADVCRRMFVDSDVQLKIDGGVAWTVTCYTTCFHFRQWKMFQLSTICRRESGSKIFTFSYGLKTLVRKKFIGSCSLRLRQMTVKSYHFVARNKDYKTIPSLLLPRPPRGRHTSLPPTLPRPSSVQKNDLLRLKFRFADTGNGKQKLNLSSFGGPIKPWVRKPRNVAL
jgi:hypothetical protein